MAGEIGSFNQYGHSTRIGSGSSSFQYKSDTQITEQSSGSSSYSESFSGLPPGLFKKDGENPQGNGNGNGNGNGWGENKFNATNEMSFIRNLVTNSNESGQGQEQYSFNNANFRSEQGAFSR